jgi:soluble cytochrome b562
MSRFMQKTCAVLSIALLSFSLASAAQAGEVKKLMKDMKVAMQQAMASKSMPEFSQNFSRLQNDAKLASEQTWRLIRPCIRKACRNCNFSLLQWMRRSRRIIWRLPSQP